MTMQDAAPSPTRKAKADARAVTLRTGPSMRRHRSDQEVETPPELIAAIVDRFGEITIDLAATPANTKAAKFFGPKVDSLSQDWAKAIGDGIGWLNPPFGNIEPWASKCRETEEALSHEAALLMLVPASVGSNWYRNHVHGIAWSIALSPRVRFVGHAQAFPKDLILCAYGARFPTGLDVWRWR